MAKARGLCAAHLMSYGSGGSRSGGGSGARRPAPRGGGSSGSPSGSRGGSTWDDDADGYGRAESRRSASRASRPPSTRGADDFGDDRRQGYGQSYGRGQSRSPGGWDERADWQPARPGARVSARDWDDDDDAGGTWAGGRGPRERRQPAQRSSAALVIAFAALLLVIVAAVIGVLVLPGRNSHPSVTIPDSPFATFTPGATPTIANQFKAFQSDRSKYAITYPSAWNATSQERTTQGQYDYIDTFALQNAPSQLLLEQAGAASSYTDQQLIQNAVSLAQQNGVTFTKADAQTPTQSVGGATWARQDYSVNANGTPVHMALLACHHSGRGYVIVLVSSAAEFGNDDQAVFEPMLASFVFL